MWGFIRDACGDFWGGCHGDETAAGHEMKRRSIRQGQADARLRDAFAWLYQT
jgi:hypothetical protein